jgi:hypothetical protein
MCVVNRGKKISSGKKWNIDPNYASLTPSKKNLQSGLPDVNIFVPKNLYLGIPILEEAGIENVGISNGHFKYLIAICNIYGQLLGIFFGNWVNFVVFRFIFPRVDQILRDEKSGNTASNQNRI